VPRVGHSFTAAARDRFVLRTPSPPATVAGGTFIDVAPRKHSRHDAAVRDSLTRRAAGEVLREELLKYPRGVRAAALLKATQDPKADLANLPARRLGEWLFAEDAWRSISERAARELADYHAAHPLRAGMAREELRSRLGIPAAAFAAVVQGLVEDGLLEEREGFVADPLHQASPEPEGGPGATLVAALGRTPFAPPSLTEAMQLSGATPELVRALAERGSIIRLSDDVAFTKDAYDAAVVLVKETITSTGSVTVAQLRDRMGASRRPVLALLEHLDAERVTRRVGDARVLR
jgi:selenocysteine-specific elongation factor